MDYIAAIWFLLIYEALSWPLRLALTPISMSGDTRRMVSRVAGPAIIVLTAWLFGHLNVHINPIMSLVWYAIFFLGAWLFCRSQGTRPEWRLVFSPITDRGRWKREAFVEVAGLVMFFSYLWFRRLNPDMITHSVNGHGSEKFDNAMFFWSSWHARSLPPEDYWLAGQEMHYYYYGQFFWAWIGRFSFLPGEWVITLGLARVTQLIWESCYLLLRSFGARSVSAALGAVLACWMSNPAAYRTFRNQYDNFTGYGAQLLADKEATSRWDEKFRAAFDDPNKKWDWGGYAFWEPAHGVIPNNIVEYTAWTAILGDFHAHHLSLPWAIGLVALVIAGPRWLRFRTLSETIDPEADGETRRGPPISTDVRAWGRAGLWFLIYWALGVSATSSNVWALGLTLATGLGIFLWRLPRPLWSLRTGITAAIRLGAVVALTCGLFLGLRLTMGTFGDPTKPQETEVAAAAADGQTPPKERTIMVLAHEIQSKIPELMWHWGFQAGAMALGIFVFLGSRAKRIFSDRGALVGVSSLLISAIVLTLIYYGLTAAHKNLEPGARVFPNENGFIWLILGSLFATLALTKRPFFRPLGVVYCVLTLVLLWGLEVVFINDAMGGTHERYNSYFKNAVPAWPLMTAAAWMCLSRVWHLRRFVVVPVPAPARWGLRAAMLAVLPFASALVVFGAPSRVTMGRLMNDSGASYLVNPEPTLNAFNWGVNLPSYRSDANLLEWIRENVPPRERMAEVVTFGGTDRYNYRGRVASLAGRPVLLGWNGHEYTWRSHEFAKPITTNYQILNDIYNAPTPLLMRDAAKKMGVKWIVFGKNEIEQFKGERKSDVESANRVYQKLLQIADVRVMFGSGERMVFLFKLRE